MLINDEKLRLQLNEVKKRMKSHVKSGDAYLDGSLDYLMASGGKMLRPTLLLVGSTIGKAHEERREGLVKLATAVETIHLATLIHDDIIDQSDYRRGNLSIQAKYGQSYAVYMGDYLLSECFLLLTHLDLEKEQAIGLAKVVRRICIGDMKQNQLRYDTSVSPYQYIKVVSGKTAALISLSLSSGAYYAGASEADVKCLGRIGYEMGMAFQLKDDLLDYQGEMSVVGKEVRVDIQRGYYSMPVIYSLAQGNEKSKRLKELLTGTLDEGEMDEVYKLIHGSGGVAQTEALAKRYTERAMALVEKVPDGRTKDILMVLVPALLDRNL